jgi:hypothetical protein
MIDKLDLRIPRGTMWRPAVARLTSLHPLESYSSRVRPTLHYAGRADLREIGIDAFLHLQCKHGDHDSKLEILDVGKKTYSEIFAVIESVAQVDPTQLAIMRMDLAGDLADVTVPWVKSHLRIKFKRTEVEYGQFQYCLVGHGEVETILAGSRPNVYRIYNKRKEWQVQFRRLQRKQSSDADPLEFEREFGLKETDVLTRFERQLRGNRIPVEIANFRSLRSLPDFNPFESLEIITSGESALPSPTECNGLNYYTGIGLNAEANRLGMHGFRKVLNKQTKGNAARTVQRYRQFFPDGSEPAISIDQIIEAYRQSTIDQLAS